MIFGVPRERVHGERRVAVVPETVSRLIKSGHAFVVESGAGDEANISDEAYRSAGAKIGDVQEVYQADVVLKIRPPMMGDPENELNFLQNGSVLIGLLQPLISDPELIEGLAKKNVTSFSLDAMPRISRAQGMDVLSSQSTVGGYRAAIIAATHLEKFYPLLMTAAGTIAPAKVLVLGAGVAGLQAIATSRRLGASVQAFDTRPVVREQVESLGASFLTFDVTVEQTKDGYAQELAEDVHQRELEFLSGPVAEADVVITTAAIPGAPAPQLITHEMVSAMRPGSVIVDLAAETGGNCDDTVAGKTVTVNGVSIIGVVNAPSQLPLNASQLYARNLLNFVNLLLGAELTRDSESQEIRFKDEDEIIQRTLITRGGKIVHEATLTRLSAQGMSVGS